MNSKEEIEKLNDIIIKQNLLFDELVENYKQTNKISKERIKALEELVCKLNRNVMKL